MVISLYLRVTVNHHRLAIANQSAECHVFRKVQVFDGFAGDAGIGSRHQLRHVGIGKCQAFDIRDIGIQQELVDMTGCYQLLIDNRANIHAFRQGDIIDVLYLGDGLEDSHALGGKTSEDVRT